MTDESLNLNIHIRKREDLDLVMVPGDREELQLEIIYKHGNKVKRQISFRKKRSALVYYMIGITLCLIHNTAAFKDDLDYKHFDNFEGKSARSPILSESVIVQDATKVQANDKTQPIQQKAQEDDHSLFGKFKAGKEKHSEENRKKRQVDEAETREKQEEQEQLSTERRMVASTDFPLDTTKDPYEIVTPIIKENGTLIIKFEHSEDEDEQKKCRVKLNTDQYSSKEQQDGNIIIEKSESLCTFQIKQFTMEKYVNATFTLDYGLDRIVETTLFWKTLINRVATYNPNDKKGIVTILTVGEHIQCSIQPPNIVNNKSEERGNIVTKKIFQYEKEQICLYNISCSIRGTFTSIINEIEMCKGVPTVPPLPTVFTTLPSYSEVTGYNATTDNYVYTNTTSSNSGSRSDIVDPKLIVIPVVIAIVIICLFVYLYIKRDKLKQWYRKRHDADESQDIEKGQEEIKMNVTEPDGVNISKTVTNQPLLQDRPSNLFVTRV